MNKLINYKGGFREAAITIIKSQKKKKKNYFEHVHVPLAHSWSYMTNANFKPNKSEQCVPTLVSILLKLNILTPYIFNQCDTLSAWNINNLYYCDTEVPIFLMYSYLQSHINLLFLSPMLVLSKNFIKKK